MKTLKVPLLLIFAIAAFFSFYHENNTGHFKNTINIDGVGYNAWLPATFLYHGDYNWEFKDSVLEKNPAYHNRIQFFTYNSGQSEKINKYSPGLAIASAPFWFMAWGFTKLSQSSVTGYEMPFQVAVWINNIFWLILGCALFSGLLRKRGFSTAQVTVINVLLLFGTNLFHFITFDVSLTHPVTIGFTLIAFCLLEKWLEENKLFYWVLFCIVAVLLVLIRPFNVLLLPLFLFRIFPDKANVIRWNAKTILSAFCAIIAGFVIYAGSIYVQTGHWFEYTYKQETFHFERFQLPHILFGFECGLFIYTPVAFFFFWFLFLAKWSLKRKVLFSGFLLVFIWIVSCWADPCYGCRLGNRPLTDLYPWLLFPLLYVGPGALHFRRKWLWILPVFFLYYNQILHYQYRHYIIDWCDMDFAHFKKSFLMTHKPD